MFYGVFSAWVLWARQTPAPTGPFNWHDSVWHLRAPVIRALFQQLSDPGRLQPLGLGGGAGLDGGGPGTGWTARHSSTGSTRARPFHTSTSRSWRPSTPPCASSLASGTPPPKWCATWWPASTAPSRTTSASRTDWLLKTSMFSTLAAAPAPISPRRCGGIAANLEGKGLGALAGAQVKKAATGRVFGFEIMPAPFVVAHLQVGLTMQDLDAALSDDASERPGVFLTNALTGWEPTPQKPLPFPELEQERDRAEGGKAEEASSGYPG